MNIISRCKTSIALIMIPVVLSGCAAHTMISKRNLAVETKMTNTIFLEPVEPEQKTVYLQIKNTSDKPDLHIVESIKSSIQSKGYKITNSPKSAHYIIQANILQVGASNLRDMERAMGGGYGSALTGAITGATAGVLINNNSGTVPLLGGLIGAAAGVAMDAMVKDVMYSIVTDIQISERLSGNVIAKQSTQSKLKQGTSGTVNVTSNQTTNWNKYQTRIISSANKVNLKFEEAMPKLIAGLSQSIAGIL